MVASLLPVSKGDRVLDMCAAPGGKTLSIALRLEGDGELISNDRSPDRRTRLKAVIEECLSEKEKSIIKVKGYDASSWCLYEREAYDAVLLDAPCSSERHVFLDPKHLSIWSPSRPKRLAKEQYADAKAKFDKTQSELAPHKAELEKKLSSLEKGIDKDIVESYKKRRVENIFPVVVPLAGNCCGGCRTELSLANLSVLKEKGVLTCEHCHRIIYVK